jgi:hypothetical protein
MVVELSRVEKYGMDVSLVLAGHEPERGMSPVCTLGLGRSGVDEDLFVAQNDCGIRADNCDGT